MRVSQEPASRRYCVAFHHKLRKNAIFMAGDGGTGNDSKRARMAWPTVTAHRRFCSEHHLKSGAHDNNADILINSVST